MQCVGSESLVLGMFAPGSPGGSAHASPCGPRQEPLTSTGRSLGWARQAPRVRQCHVGWRHGGAPHRREEGFGAAHVGPELGETCRVLTRGQMEAPGRHEPQLSPRPAG